MKKAATYQTPVLFFKRKDFKNFISNIGLDPECVYPPLDIDILEYSSEVANKSLKMPFIIYDIDLSKFSRERRYEIKNQLNKSQPDFNFKVKNRPQPNFF